MLMRLPVAAALGLLSGVFVVLTGVLMQLFASSVVEERERARHVTCTNHLRLGLPGFSLPTPAADSDEDD